MGHFFCKKKFAKSKRMTTFDENASSMLTNFFFSLCFLSIAYELFCVANPKLTIGVHAAIQSRDSFKDSHPTLYYPVAAGLIGYLVWAFIGLFTSQWLLFLVFWTATSLVPYKTPQGYRFIHMFCAIVQVLILTNKLWIHINFRDVIGTYAGSIF